MPGVDFNRLRSEITMEQVLNMIRFEPSRQSGDQWYGCCPLHNCTSKNRRCFSVNVATGRYYCHRCHRHGNQLELWAAFTLHFRGSSSESKQVLKEGPQFGVVGSVRQSDQEFFTQHFSGN